MITAPASNTQFDPSSATSDPSRIDWLNEFPPPRSLLLDRDALRIYEHAYALGLAVEANGSPPVTFSTVLAALLTGRDETSNWFASQAATYGPVETSVFAEKRTERAAVESLRPSIPGRPPAIRLSSDRHLLTASARSLLGIAESWAQSVRGSEIGVRHLVAAYVLNPPAAHRAQMQQWGFQEAPWRQVFFQWVAERNSAEQWTDASHRPAPAQAIPEIERVQVKGVAVAFPGDEHALSVLQCAAELHARRPDDWLGVQTLWHAIIQKSGDTDVLPALAPIVAATETAGRQYQRAVSAYFGTTTLKKSVVPFEALDISPRVSTALETARALAVATQADAAREVRVSVLHLAGALVSRRVDCDPELASFGFNPNDLRAKLIEQAEKLGESGDAWCDAVGAQATAEAGRPIELNSDEPEATILGDEAWADDPLNIRRDVETFASLLASKKLEPPLSIGLFGPWGSGKTTFLKRLRLAVARRANEAQIAASANTSTPYVENVVHVDFNAWHYSEAALTSSLVDTILRRLADHITNNQPVAGKEWERQKIENLESTRRKVQAADAVLAAASTAVTAAATDLTEEQHKAARATVGLQSAAQEVWAATLDSFKNDSALTTSGALAALSGTAASVGELRTRLDALRNRPARMLRELGWARTLMFAALVIGVPPLVAWASTKFLGTNGAAPFISAATTALSLLGVWARAASSAVTSVDAALEKVAERYAAKVADSKELERAQTQLAVAQAHAATAAAALQAAREELARARVDAAHATLPAQMLQLATNRFEAQSYTRELTTTSLARADLEAISTLLRGLRSQAPNPPVTAVAEAIADTVATSELKRVERVILYIDDLDRCKPQDVVRVLQLVHMLLAFDLFAVVVAVDARWVEESLHQSYEWLSVDTGASNGGIPGAKSQHAVASRITPQDYLEKIFQVSFWLKPMTAPFAAEYLKSLVRVQPAQSGSATETASSSTGGAGTPSAAPIQIEAMELDYMRYLAGYVGTSPRRVKRLVNAYRLIKANLTDPQLQSFLTRASRDEDGRPRSGPYQLVIGLLAIGTGAPASAAQIFREIGASDPKTAPDSIVQRFRATNLPDWSMAAQVIEQVLRSQRAKDIRELRDWTANVGRFLLKSPLSDDASAFQSALP